MNKTLIAVVIAAALAAAGGYWYGSRGAHEVMPAADNMADAGKGAEQGGRKILYYRNPMGLPDTSPTPKKDSMGMDYIPVYEGEDQDDGGTVKLSQAKIQRLGVRVAPAERRTLDAVVRAAGRIEVDERRLTNITPKFEGYIEKLYVNAVGQPVARGDKLFDAYSPDLLAAQREYAVAAQALAQLKDADAQAQAGMKRLADSALARLRNWDVNDEQVAALAAGAEPRRELAFRAPAGGIVMERKAVQGMRFMPGEMLYQIADLSSVWLIADVFEQDIGRLRVGQPAQVQLQAYPGEVFEGRVGYIYPTLRADTRSAQVRIELPNRGGRLKPAMYAQVEIPTGGGTVLAIPSEAVIDNGTRRVVLVDKGEGRFEPREVKLGARGQDYVAVLEGLKEGEPVVVAAQFLIDSESNLKSALAGLTGGSNAGAGAAHRATGKLDDVDAKTGTWIVTHEPVPSLKWPKMTMEFKPANEAVGKDLKPGTAIDFEFDERKPGEWVITKVEARK
jgi:RND family efflux transporter MFP subunit